MCSSDWSQTCHSPASASQVKGLSHYHILLYDFNIVFEHESYMFICYRSFAFYCWLSSHLYDFLLFTHNPADGCLGTLPSFFFLFNILPLKVVFVILFQAMILYIHVHEFPWILKSKSRTVGLCFS